MEHENDNKELNFVDVTIRNNLIHSYNFSVYHKLAITNVQIKLPPNISPNIVMGVFKRFLSCGLHICSAKCLVKEIKFLINLFTKNGHSITALEKVSK